MAKKNKTTNHYQVLGLDNFSNTEQVVAAFNQLSQKHRNMHSPTENDALEYSRIEQAFATLIDENSKVEYDNKLSAFLNTQKGSVLKNKVKKTKGSSDTNEQKINPKFANIAIIAVALVASGVYYFQSKNNITNINEQAELVKPKPAMEQTQQEQPTGSSIFLNDFINESQRQRSASLFFGLLGDQEIKGLIQYTPDQFTGKISTTPTGEPFPNYSGVLPNFSTYNFGEAKLILKNPTSENAFVKVISLDENENFVVRHAYILSGDQVALSGLPEGAVQIAVLFPNHPQIAFLTQQYKVFNDAENLMPIYGQKFSPSALF